VSKFPQPEAFQASVSFFKRFRIQFASAGTTVFTNQDMGRLLSVVLTPTDAIPLVDRFRIQRIEVFGPMSSTLVPVTVKLEYLGSTGSVTGTTKLYSDTSMSSVAAAYLNVRPDPNSGPGMWNLGGPNTTNMVSITYPAATIIDIVLEVTLNDGAVVTTPFVVAGGVAGQLGTKCPTGASSLGLPNL